ncbi:MAG: hypothetical protein QXU99_00825 [Candidatus Bathyarchaeia archaeon]
MTEPEKFKLKDILYGLVLPVIVAIIILLFPTVIKNACDAAFPPANMATGDPGSPYAFITVILTHGFALMICFAVPLIMGLIWNKWAGGATGFLMGTLYYLANAGYNIMYSMKNFGLEYTYNLYADPSFIGNYIVGGILIGYIAGALNNRSTSFKRMLGAGLTASITVGVMQFILNMTVAFAAWMAQADPFTAFYQVLLPLVILAIIAPIVAKVFTWYGIMPGGHH